LSNACTKLVSGNISDPELLERAGIGSGHIALVLAWLENDGGTFDVVHSIREGNSECTVVAECVDDENRKRLVGAGASNVILTDALLSRDGCGGLAVIGIERDSHEFIHGCPRTDNLLRERRERFLNSHRLQVPGAGERNTHRLPQLGGLRDRDGAKCEANFRRQRHLRIIRKFEYLRVWSTTGIVLVYKSCATPNYRSTSSGRD
jgi:hypothetical protein